MNRPTLDLSGGGNFDITGLYDKVSWPGIRLVFKRKNGTPVPLQGIWKMRVFELDEFPDGLFEEFAQGTGLTVSGNVMTINRPTSKIIPSKRYHYEILNKVGDEVFIFFSGSLTINKTKSWD